jgi:Ca-activated chloride channel homolog
MMVEWARSEALLLLLPLFALAWWVWRARALAVPLPRGEALASGSIWPALISRIPLVLRFFTLALLVLAIAGPRTAGAVIEEETTGVPIVVAVDLSSSMLARDLGPDDRLTVARQALRSFIAERPNDPIGLVAFAGESLTLVPITMHRRVLASAVDQLVIGLLEDGTAIGEGLATAVARLRRVEAASRVVVLLSDGENNRGEIEPLQAAQAAVALGIVVHTIGVGTDRPATTIAAPGIALGEAIGGLDETLLREIAALTGGQYFRADQPGALDRIYAEIDGLVVSPVETRRHLRHREWQMWLLLAAGLLLMGEWALRSSRWGAMP